MNVLSTFDLNKLEEFMFTSMRLLNLDLKTNVNLENSEPVLKPKSVTLPFFDEIPLKPKSVKPPTDPYDEIQVCLKKQEDKVEYKTKVKTEYKAKVKTEYNGMKTEYNGKSDLFYPKQKDTLFWSFYILKNSFESYEMLGHINIVVEKKLKIEYVELLRMKKQELKSKKIAQMAHVENQLANEYIIDLKTFFMLCAIEKINILYIHKKSFYLLNHDEVEELDNGIKDYGIIHLIKKNDFGNKYGFTENITAEQVNKYKETFFCVDNISKPIRGNSFYTIKDLIEIAKKLNIEIVNETTQKPKTKNELYESIVQYF